MKALEGPLWRALLVFRIAALGYAAVLMVGNFQHYHWPLGGWLVLSVMAAWTVVSSLAYARPERRGWPLLTADLAVTAACLLSTRWIVQPDGLGVGAPTLPMAWVASPVVAWAISGGRRRGAIAALLMSAADVVVRDGFSQATVNGPVLMLLAGVGIGHIARLAIDAEARLQRAVELEAATRERERLARGIHDSVLQVLALLQRRGAELGGEAAELGRLAGEQEATLRTLVTSSGPAPVRRRASPAAAPAPGHRAFRLPASLSRRQPGGRDAGTVPARGPSSPGTPSPGSSAASGMSASGVSTAGASAPGAASAGAKVPAAGASAPSRGSGAGAAGASEGDAATLAAASPRDGLPNALSPGASPGASSREAFAHGFAAGAGDPGASAAAAPAVAAGAPADAALGASPSSASTPSDLPHEPSTFGGGSGSASGVAGGASGIAGGASGGAGPHAALAGDAATTGDGGGPAADDLWSDLPSRAAGRGSSPGEPLDGAGLGRAESSDNPGVDGAAAPGGSSPGVGPARPVGPAGAAGGGSSSGAGGRAARGWSLFGFGGRRSRAGSPGGAAARRRPSRWGSAEGDASRGLYSSDDEQLDLVDLRSLLSRHSVSGVSVAAPATEVLLPAPVAAEVAAAVAAAVDNVHLHAGPGAKAWLLVEELDDTVTVTIRDNGPGIPEGRLAEAEQAGRLGLAQSIRGRIRDLGGTTTITSSPTTGTEIELHVPR
ncbi:DUF5931 domain-containing protein [Dactylosporangium aurantiacum]|nr:DUF5931 domain-containing protein [Dactylosporangium aurantiacum]MDG6110452.1 DUF5931 domain-containing protein [Dactylosporangium aurantiacum]